MAKKFSATEHEVRNIINANLVDSVVRKDWYGQRYVVEAGCFLNELVYLEFPVLLPRDKTESSIIPGYLTKIEDANTTQMLMECLGVETGTDYVFSVMTGRLFSAHGNDPTRFALIEPRRARDVMLLASRQKGTPLPKNCVNHIICGSQVFKYVVFGFDNACSARSSATWIISAKSPLGERLVAEADKFYAKRLQDGIVHFKDYAHTYGKVRDELWARLSSIPHDATGDPSLPRLDFHDRYIHAEWHDAYGLCDNYFFYTETGVCLVEDLINSWRKDENRFSLEYSF